MSISKKKECGQSIRLSKKAQAIYLDLFISIFIIIAALIILMNSEVNLFGAKGSGIRDLLSDAESISESLMGTGLPEDWNRTNVLVFGITKDYRINSEKLAEFDFIASTDYGRAKQILHTPYDFILFFENKNGIAEIGGNRFFGKTGVNSTNIHEIERPNNLVGVTRLIILDSMPSKMTLYLWD